MPVKINGATSGSVTLAAPATGSDVTLTLPAAAGTVATLNSPAFTGTPTFNGVPVGKVLQVVYGSTTTTVTTTSATNSDTTLTATITPSSTSSKILVQIAQHTYAETNVVYATINAVRGSTGIGDQLAMLPTNTGMPIYLTVFDSPATTSPVTYKTQFSRNDGSGTVNVQRFGKRSTIVLIEVAQ